MARSREEARAAVLENSIPVPESGCWLYLGSVNWFTAPNHVKFNNGTDSPQRLVMRAKPGDVVCHHCDVPSCINPDHMYIGTHQTNRIDREVRGRSPEYYKVTPDELKLILESPLPSTQLAKHVNITASRIRAIRVKFGQKRQVGAPYGNLNRLGGFTGVTT